MKSPKSKKKLKRAKITKRPEREQRAGSWNLGEFAILIFLNVIILYSLLYLVCGKAPFGF